MLKFLVVDDAPDVCSVISDYLHDKFDAAVDCTASASEGARNIAAATYNLAVVDILMTDFNGLALAGLAANENIPVILTSGDHDEAAKIARSGCDCLQ